MITFTPKDPAEALFYGIDFSNLLGSGETITSATASMRVVSGTDAAPSAMLSGSPVVNGGIVSHKLTGGVAGVVYLLGLTIYTSAGQTIIEAAPLTVRERD